MLRCLATHYIRPSTNKKCKKFCSQLRIAIFALLKVLIKAEVAHLVEHDLAKVGVAGSSPVFRSNPLALREDFLSQDCPGGGIGRHAGLKILFAATRVTVQVRSGARITADQKWSAFLHLQHFQTFVFHLTEVFTSTFKEFTKKITAWSGIRCEI